MKLPKRCVLTSCACLLFALDLPCTCLLQIPAFLLVGVTLRMMGSMGWPGFRSEGALWFPDLTQVGGGQPEQLVIL
jgi:hypothetical protein